MTACPSCAVPVLPARLLLTAESVRVVPVTVDAAPVEVTEGTLVFPMGCRPPSLCSVLTESLHAHRQDCADCRGRTPHAHRLHVCDRLPEGALWSLDRVADEVTV